MLSWALRTLAIWAAVLGVLFAAFQFHDPLVHGLLGKANPPTAFLAGGNAGSSRYASKAPPDEIIVRRADNGHFYVDADVNGARIHFLVDTGASVVVLSPDDARAAGVSVGDSDFSGVVSTANGETRVAPVTLRTIGLDQLNLFDVEGVVVDHAMPVSLLGMSALKRLAGYEIRGDELILRW